MGAMMGATMVKLAQLKTAQEGSGQLPPEPDGSPSTERTAALCKHSIPTPIVDYSTPQDVTGYTAPRAAERQVR